MDGVKQMAAGYGHTLLLLEYGSVMSFGYNQYGQLGRTENTNANPTPFVIILE